MRYTPSSLIGVAILSGLALMLASPTALAQKRGSPPGKKNGQQQSTNTAPTISGTPATSVTVGTAYRFVPTARDADGNALTFSITGRPGWTSFDATTGTLSGTPSAADVATYANIVISVSDGRATARLPAFSITVAQQQPTNTAPTISGTPATSVTVGTAYSFVPSARDADGNALTFSITGRPGWASFDATTGTLSGTPSAADVATYSNIVIGVSDGQATARLPAFSVTVQAYSFGSITLSWTPPTQNTDGSALTDLAGYRIYWGPQATNYTNSVAVMSPGITSYVVENLASGTYYFAATAVNAYGVESALSTAAPAVVR